MSTRKGTAIALDALLDEAEKRALSVIREKNPDLPHADSVAKMVGIGAVKYFDLSHNRKSDIVFEWGKALSFEGNTGPYLQYTHARLKSILRKNANKEIVKHRMFDSWLTPVEHRLVSALLRYPAEIERSLTERSPHMLAAYLYELSSMANEFYHALPVLQEKDESVKSFRLKLVSATAITLKNGLNLLGIEAPEEM